MCACVCVEPRCSLRGPWCTYDSSISHVHCSSRSWVTFLKGVCEFSCVTWTTIATFLQQCVKSPVKILLFSNVRFEAISLRTTKMRVVPYCVPTKRKGEVQQRQGDKNISQMSSYSQCHVRQWPAVGERESNTDVYFVKNTVFLVYMSAG